MENSFLRVHLMHGAIGRTEDSRAIQEIKLRKES